MAFLTLEGIYKDGKIELTEVPGPVGSPARVLVTFLPTEVGPSGLDADASVDRETLRSRAFARMREGIPMGGPPYPSREELHD